MANGTWQPRRGLVVGHPSLIRLVLFVALTIALASPADAADDDPQAKRPPNFVIVFADDLGYADVGCFGAQGYQTPHIDRLAREGCRFTSFYVAQAVCSASRAALLTGCYNVRVGILGALGPGSEIGIADDEWTLAETLKQRNYATAIYGKWHLGHHPQFLPTRHGFDDYYGLPYSNDMWPFHPTAGDRFPDLPLIDGEKVVNPKVSPEDQRQLTTDYTRRAVKFIEAHRDQPFLVYLAHSMPHVPLFVSDKFEGKSQRGLFGDVIREIDWSVGQILETLERLDLDGNTLVLFTSDNGPWLSYGDHAGSAHPLREGKGTMFEGGCRVPCVARFPGRIPAGTVVDAMASTIDILPTFAHLAGAPLPPNKIDGLNIWPLMAGQQNGKPPRETFYFYYGRELQAVREGQWKLHFPHGYRTLQGRPGGTGGQPVPYAQATIGLELFDLEADVGETTNLADKHPEVVARLKQLGDRARAELGDSITKQTGSGVRPPGRLKQ